MIDWYIKRVGKMLEYADIPVTPRKFLWFNLWFSILGSLIWIIPHVKNPINGIYAITTFFFLINIGLFSFLVIVKNKRAEAAQEYLPDYLLLFANNIRSGYTPEQAMIVSAKKEFGVLSVEVKRAMRGGISNKPIEELLPKIGESIDSNVIRNTFSLIAEGVQSGGELARLLEQTSYDVRKFDSVRKDIDSVISVYQLFIASAACVAAPLLISTSGFIVNIILSIRSKVTPSEMLSSKTFFLNSSVPMIDSTSLLVFSFISLLVITFFASLAIGLIGKGKHTEGLKFFPIMFAVACAIFIVIRGLLEVGLGGLFHVN